MKSITIRADEGFIAEAVKAIKALAKEKNAQVSISADKIKAELEADIKAFKEGRLKTLTLDEMKEICAKW